MRKETIGQILRFWMGITVLVLAFAIIYFSNALLKVNKNLPSIIDQVTLINKNIDTITKKSIPNILKAIPEITAQIDNVQSKIPLIINETQNIRETTVPQILKEVENINKQIPSILMRIDSINSKVPSITTSISEVIITANQALSRVDSINEQIPEIMATIKITNDSISNYMVQAKVLVEEANEIANSAGRDATKGFLTGIISTPFDITKGIGGFIFGSNSNVNGEDIKVLDAEIKSFLNKNSNEIETLWQNSNTKTSGKITVLKTFTKKGKTIKKMKVTIKQSNNDDKERSDNVYFYRKEDGKWSFWK